MQKLLENCIPNFQRLLALKISLAVGKCIFFSSGCPLHERAKETIDHLFLSYPFSWQVSFSTVEWMQVKKVSGSIKHWRSFHPYLKGRHIIRRVQRAGLMAVVYHLWLERSKHFYGGKFNATKDVIVSMEVDICTGLYIVLKFIFIKIAF